MSGRKLTKRNSVYWIMFSDVCLAAYSTHHSMVIDIQSLFSTQARHFMEPSSLPMPNDRFKIGCDCRSQSRQKQKRDLALVATDDLRIQSCNGVAPRRTTESLSQLYSGGLHFLKVSIRRDLELHLCSLQIGNFNRRIWPESRSGPKGSSTRVAERNQIRRPSPPMPRRRRSLSSAPGFPQSLRRSG